MDANELEKKKQAVINVYSYSPSWAQKVQRMTPAQITAIYIRFQSLGRLG